MGPDMFLCALREIPQLLSFLEDSFTLLEILTVPGFGHLGLVFSGHCFVTCDCVGSCSVGSDFVGFCFIGYRFQLHYASLSGLWCF